MAEKETSIFETLNAVNVNEHTDKKGNLTYLSWSDAWSELKKVYPDASFKIYERETQYGPCNYFTDGVSCWVKVGVTINDVEQIEELPVMDFRNVSIPLKLVTSMDIAKAIKRCLTKCIALWGLGLYLYRAEDIPDEEAEKKRKEEEKKIAKELNEAGRDKEIGGVAVSDKLPPQAQNLPEKHIPSAYDI